MLLPRAEYIFFFFLFLIEKQSISNVRSLFSVNDYRFFFFFLVFQNNPHVIWASTSRFI